MCISVSYFAGIVVALVWFLPRWVWCRELVCSHAISPILSGCKLGVVGLSSRRCYHMVHGEFPCCLVGGRLDSVGAVVFPVLFPSSCFSLKHNLSETAFCLWRQGLTLLIGSNWVGFVWRRRQNPVSETLCFKQSRTTDNDQKHNICINVPSSQTFISYLQ
jgi:hypothetical protein